MSVCLVCVCVYVWCVCVQGRQRQREREHTHRDPPPTRNPYIHDDGLQTLRLGNGVHGQKREEDIQGELEDLQLGTRLLPHPQSASWSVSLFLHPPVSPLLPHSLSCTYIHTSGVTHIHMHVLGGLVDAFHRQRCNLQHFDDMAVEQRCAMPLPHKNSHPQHNMHSLLHQLLLHFLPPLHLLTMPLPVQDTQ